MVKYFSLELFILVGLMMSLDFVFTLKGGFRKGMSVFGRGHELEKCVQGVGFEIHL